MVGTRYIHTEWGRGGGGGGGHLKSNSRTDLRVHGNHYKTKQFLRRQCLRVCVCLCVHALVYEEVATLK